METILNMNKNDYIVGNVTKSRFTDKIGNDQLWEGKGEERKYNTDFIGYSPRSSDAASGGLHIMGCTNLLDTFLDPTKLDNEHITEPEYTNGINANYNNLFTTNGYVPYLADKPESDWLSDHALVYKTIYFGSVDDINIGGGGMKYIRNRRNIKSRGNRRNSKKTRRNRRNRRKSIGKRRKTRRKIKSKRHSRKYKRL